ncbi:MAG: hypothetical protein QF502_04415 [Nitrospinaceae bacterium]|jgi:hypothetical protein|nr:hypothetical protein [Rhodospirillaceae bacterium]MDP6477132.1 hypothetical protein [Nitrospinaceae bacterium]|tara:strand:- start:2176 stop:2388 length:213 start_codon:yes stop_codon:yes gene_type:complete
MKHYLILLSFAFILLDSNNVQAYVGPGLGAGTLAMVLGFIGSIFLALFAILWYPIKRIIRKIKGNKGKTN